MRAAGGLNDLDVKTLVGKITLVHRHIERQIAGEVYRFGNDNLFKGGGFAAGDCTGGGAGSWR
ncbi:hypothetical protein SDC9_202832 [bioreactor metagenome]|uniref:Uncharacterized protein n=1 Tax=bioreactor metagenome TaxID=1076179 RepID=A0A645J6P9_9ZZZZ